jgi:hypothetical protein
MNRRKFLKLSAGASAWMLGAPYVLPSGRLFAREAERKIRHVVLCVFGGGVRNIESVHQAAGGNLMPHMLAGARTTWEGIPPLPQQLFAKPMSASGTLFPEFRFAEGITAHYPAHGMVLMGKYTRFGVGQEFNRSTAWPTLFELYHKHRDPSDFNSRAWWVGMDNQFAALAHSTHPDFGSAYAANYLMPNHHFMPMPKSLGNQTLGAVDAAQRDTTDLRSMTCLLGKGISPGQLPPGNPPVEEAHRLQFQQFLAQHHTELGQKVPFQKLKLSDWQFSPDLMSAYYAAELFKTLRPELLAFQMMLSDYGHINQTGYLQNLQWSDYALGYMWQTIQADRELRDNTVLIAVPEHGRNLHHNSIRDTYGRYSTDHTSDPTSREIFCLIAGPKHLVNQGTVVGTPQNPVGQTIDVMPTIAWLLGFHDKLPNLGYEGRILEEAFV